LASLLDIRKAKLKEAFGWIDAGVEEELCGAGGRKYEKSHYETKREDSMVRLIELIQHGT